MTMNTQPQLQQEQQPSQEQQEKQHQRLTEVHRNGKNNHNYNNRKWRSHTNFPASGWKPSKLPSSRTVLKNKKKKPSKKLLLRTTLCLILILATVVFSFNLRYALVVESSARTTTGESSNSYFSSWSSFSYKNNGRKTRQPKQRQQQQQKQQVKPVSLATLRELQKLSIIVVGGTDGSGTRAFVDALGDLGIPMVYDNKGTLDIEGYELFDGNGWPPLIEHILQQTHSADYQWPGDFPQDIQDILIGEMSKLCESIIQKYKNKHFFLRKPQQQHTTMSLSTTSIWFGIKVPASMLALPLLQQFFPRIKFIHIVRDGRDVSLSKNQSPVIKFYQSMYEFIHTNRTTTTTTPTSTAANTSQNQHGMMKNNDPEYENRIATWKDGLYHVRAMELWKDWNRQVYEYSIKQAQQLSNDVNDININGRTTTSRTTKATIHPGNNSVDNDTATSTTTAPSANLRSLIDPFPKSFEYLMLRTEDLIHPNKKWYVYQVLADFVGYVPSSSVSSSTSSTSFSGANTSMMAGMIVGVDHTGTRNDHHHDNNIADDDNTTTTSTDIKKLENNNTKNTNIMNTATIRNDDKSNIVQYDHWNDLCCLVQHRLERPVEDLGHSGLVNVTSLLYHQQKQKQKQTQQQEQQNPSSIAKPKPKPAVPTPTKVVSVSQRYGKWQGMLQDKPKLSYHLHDEGKDTLQLFGYYQPRIDDFVYYMQRGLPPTTTMMTTTTTTTTQQLRGRRIPNQRFEDLLSNNSKNNNKNNSNNDVDDNDIDNHRRILLDNDNNNGNNGKRITIPSILSESCHCNKKN